MKEVNFKHARRPWTRPPYPPYHVGPYLEEYMFKFYNRRRVEFDETGRTLIPIYWTTAYLDGVDVQPYLDALPQDGKYFAVSQHDDAIKERLPRDTVVFSAGGNSGGIPIPLICSGIPLTERIKKPDSTTLLASFVGSLTHEVRRKMFKELSCHPAIRFRISNWDFGVAKEAEQAFFRKTRRSLFTLCPRGYGAQSFRTYEAIQLGSVPVYIHDDTKWLPFQGTIDWNEFAVVSHVDELPDLAKRLERISMNDYDNMQRTGQEIAEKYFTLNGVCEKILFDLTHENY